MFGPYEPTWLPPAIWTRVFGSTQRPSRLYFNESPCGIQQLAVNQFTSHHTMPPMQTPSFNLRSRGYFYTAAPLDRVVAVTPCQQTESLITGLLLHYSNGDRACVGMFRLDRAGVKMHVSNSQMLCLGFARTSRKQPYVVMVTLEPTTDASTYQWLCLPWKGELEWWFSQWQCMVNCDGRTSPMLL